METPHLLLLGSISEYQAYFDNNFCRQPILTFDDIAVFFCRDRFRHCMFESSRHNDCKDTFSKTRADRMPWIRETLINPMADLRQGWDKRYKRIDPDVRVAIAYDDSVVVIRTALDHKYNIKAEFITAYSADKSIAKIKKMPHWDKTKCRWFAKLAQRRKPL